MTKPTDIVTPEPGVYYDVPFDEYCRWDAVNASLLKQVAVCPAAALWYMQYGVEQSDAMKLGRARHHALLEPATFDQHFVVADGCGAEIKTGERKGQHCGNSARVCRGGAWYCGTHDPAKGQPSEDAREPISEADARACRYIRDSVIGHPATAAIMGAVDGRNEVSLLWLDLMTGTLCKARVDRVVPSLNILFDLKTTGGSAHPRAVVSAARRFKWALQAAHYIAGASALAEDLGVDRDELDFVFCAVGSSPPNIITPAPMTAGAMDWGELERASALQTLDECETTQHWPGYADGRPVYIELSDVEEHEESEAHDEDE